MHDMNEKFNNSLSGNLMNSLVTSIGYNLCAHLEHGVMNRLRVSLSNSLMDNLGHSLKNSIRDLLWNSFRTSLSGSLRDRLEQNTHDNEETLNAQSE